ncbi:DnaJ domain-containing protein [Aliamphritea ceti]|uniref:DnaJ domain-containing protein n=1 Tax=Aliamphritea ceti TaxID=1524258 RepID=UPI0021C295A6|nr:DnaJ domain-containing protein [Aliamphritea ceti]
MNPVTFFILSALFAVWFVWTRRQPQQQRRQTNIKLLIFILGILLFYLILTGKLHWLGAAVAVALPFVRRLWPFIPFIGRFLKQRSNRQGGNTSAVDTPILHMELDHDSGVMFGTVLEGPLKGHQLGDMSESEFIQLLNYCRQHDQQSARLLETYLDKRFGESWREDDKADNTAPLSEVEEAYQILGLEKGASETAIIEAHRRLMQKMHPDRGGSDYLAAKINQAKDILMKR